MKYDLRGAQASIQAATLVAMEPAMPPVVREMLKVGQDAAIALRDRVDNVKLAPIEDGFCMISFTLDGKPHKGRLTGRNRDLLVGFGREPDRAIATCVLLDGHATPL